MSQKTCGLMEPKGWKEDSRCTKWLFYTNKPFLWQSKGEKGRSYQNSILRPISNCRTKVCFLLKEFQTLSNRWERCLGQEASLAPSDSAVPSCHTLTRLDFWKKSKGKLIVPLMKTWNQIAGVAPQAEGALGTINWWVSGTLVGKLEEPLINAGLLYTGAGMGTGFL